VRFSTDTDVSVAWITDFTDRPVSAGAKIPHWKRPNGSVAPE